jgi:hypothetical protein
MFQVCAVVVVTVVVVVVVVVVAAAEVVVVVVVVVELFITPTKTSPAIPHTVPDTLTTPWSSTHDLWSALHLHSEPTEITAVDRPRIKTHHHIFLQLSCFAPHQTYSVFSNSLATRVTRTFVVIITC